MKNDHDQAAGAREIIETGLRMQGSGLVVGTWGNISRRCQTGGFLITPSGISYNVLRPEDLVAVDLQSGAYTGSLHPSSEVALHAAIYRARSGVAAIVHTHSPYAAVFAVNRMELPPVLDEMAQMIGGSVRVAPYADPGTRELAELAVGSLGDRTAVLLANHGLVGVGSSLNDALTVCQIVEKSAQVFLWAKLSGTPYLLGEQEIVKLRQRFIENYGQRPQEGEAIR